MACARLQCRGRRELKSLRARAPKKSRAAVTSEGVDFSPAHRDKINFMPNVWTKNMAVGTANVILRISPSFYDIYIGSLAFTIVLI